MSTPLRHALLDHPFPAYKVAGEMGIGEVRLCKIARGLIKPRESEKIALARILKKSVTDLFPCQCGRGAECCGGSGQ